MVDLYQASLGDAETNDEGEILITLEEFEEKREILRSIVDRYHMVKRLNENPDFKAIFTEGYFRDEAHRLAELMASGRLPESRMDSCLQDLRSIGRCKNYLREFVDQGVQAENDLVLLEEAREESIEAEAAQAGA